jgi:enterochelin esterase-like enzyme
MAPLRVAAAVAALVLLAPATAAAARRQAAPLPAGWTRIGAGPAGGTVWQGLIRDPRVPALRRPTVVYLPPAATAPARYPVLYLLQGFRGSPYQFTSALALADVADAAIAARRVRPFVAVAPPAGVTPRYDGEWAGPWERYLVQDVLPWVDRHLPARGGRAARALAGLSAGGYGAVDIGERHPFLFRTLEAWSGYFHPYRDGPLRDASRPALAAHDPSLLARREAPLLRRLRMRFFLSSGTTHDRATAAATRAFAAELRALRLPYATYLAQGGHDGRFWRAQLPAALRFAEPPRDGQNAKIDRPLSSTA